MTLIEAAASLGVTAATLRQQLARGSLRGRKVGRDWHVTPREVERYRLASLGKRKPAADHEFMVDEDGRCVICDNQDDHSRKLS